MEHTHYPESGADGRDALTREEISPSNDSEDSEDDHWWDDLIRYDLSVWLAGLDGATDDVPEIPPPLIVYCQDLLEKGWGWQRLVPYCHGNVDWVIFKKYLKDYFIQNAGEVAALCANKKPEKDKDYFCRITSGVKVKDKSIHSHNVSGFIQGVAADKCIESENSFRFIHDDLTAEDISLSQKIEERANYVFQSAVGYANAAAALVCIIKEADLLYQLYDCKFDTTEMVDLSKKVRQSAYELMLYEGPDSAAAAGAMLGLAKEAKFLCYVLSREDKFMHRDFNFCHDIRRQTVAALDILLQETSKYGHVSWALAVVKPEKPRGTVGYLNYASDNGDVKPSAGAESEKHQGTVVDLNCAFDNVDVNGASAGAKSGAKSEKPEGSLENFTRPRISACTQHGILQPYHILQMKSGIVGQTRFILLVRQTTTSSITKAPQQLLKTMVPVETLGGIDKVWAKMSQKNKGKGKAQLKLSYCGRLAVGEESCGFKPHISDVSWNITGHWGGASEALACTGTFGTYVYLRSNSIFMEPNIEKGWQQVIIQNTPGRFSKWSLDGKCLAVGVIRDKDNLPEVYIFYWDDKANKAMGSRVYQGTDGNCLFLNPISWSFDSRYLVAPSDRTHHVPVLKVEKKKTFIHPVRFSEQNGRPDYLCAAFHPRITLFIAASTTGRLKLYEVDESKARSGKKADIWNENGKEWDDDKIGTLDLSFCIKGDDKLACARADWTVKVWSFDYDALGLNTSLSPLFIIDPATDGNLSVKWNREIDYLAVGDGRQVISIFGYNDGSKLCGNEHNSDVSARFNQATRTDWRAKQLALVSGGHEGFILFWCLHTDPSKVILAPKQRNIHVENMYYTHKPLQHGAASTALQAFEKSQALIRLDFEKSQATMREEFERTEASLKNVVDESEMKSYQLDQIAVLANSGLSKINAGSASVGELADYFKEILRLSTKETL